MAVLKIEKELIYKELQVIKDSLHIPFPYSDIYKIQEDFIKEINPNDILTADLSAYWANIAGSLGYIERGKSEAIPQGQIDWLQLTFYDIFHQYYFLQESMINYPTFYAEYMNHEKARELLVDYLTNK
ncbi:YxiJ family protein [Sporosarcina sp. SG10008]|uniref:YxiJ family protein n=1 Tax=Sporosarcina sp. SG10008 TaxID=3373103 RepID=UPI0037DD9000